MNDIDARQQLKKIYESSLDIADLARGLEKQVVVDTDFIVSRVAKNKGVYTVLITLALYKNLNPSQDIRNHKAELPNGFSGRTFDQNNVTPVLKELNLPSMAESGWLTRSLEQAYAYDMDFNGKITPPELKEAFLRTVAYIQKGPKEAESVIRVLLNGGIKYREDNQVEINRIDSDDAQISRVVEMLEECFTANYGARGGSKLPVLAFYAIYLQILSEMSRYSGSNLAPLGSHTASDRTSNRAGDIEVLRDEFILEAVEVKLDRPPTAHMVRVAYDKIKKFGISRYYILSGVEPDETELEEINQLIIEIERDHGCQLIVNGLYESLKYYLRLISSPKVFLDKFTDLVESDTELLTIHKSTLSDLIQKYFG